MVQKPFKTDPEVQEKMSPNLAQKSVVINYDGFERTITQVVQIRQNDTNDDDPAKVITLIEGLDSAVKECRVLRKRLESIYKKRLKLNTGLYRRRMNHPKPESI